MNGFDTVRCALAHKPKTVCGSSGRPGPSDLVFAERVDSGLIE